MGTYYIFKLNSYPQNEIMGLPLAKYISVNNNIIKIQFILVITILHFIFIFLHIGNKQKYRKIYTG